MRQTRTQQNLHYFWHALFAGEQEDSGADSGAEQEDPEGGEGVALMEEALDILEQARAMLSEAESKVRCSQP